LLLLGRFSSNHSIIAFIPHTAPDDRTPSKNHDTDSGVLNITFVGEYINRDMMNPPQVEKHIGQVKIPEMNPPKKLKGKCLSLPHFAKKFLNP
jgi:hypothetical protein